MLPSRLHRNLGIPPPLRSLLIPHPSLPATIAVQLRFRLGVLPGSLESLSNPRGPVWASSFSTSAASGNSVSPATSTRKNAQDASQATSSSPSIPAATSAEAAPVDEPRMQITFTCTASDCDRTRSTHQFTKRAYEKGIVLIQCPGCRNR